MTNVGSVDRMLRLLIGAALLVAFFSDFFAGWGAWKYVVPAVGIVLLATAILRICPAYSLFGINTAKT